ncbi:MAG: peptidoglycan DD-metalloendopeptidase family protein [Clostridia bacterium]|nr:peptidoglycan DD-metalloendopeptidase family protein [Clostridia bacterium]
MIEYIFQRILLLSLSGALATAIVLPMSFITKKAFSSRWRYYTCLMALLVFLIPLSMKLPHGDIDKDTQDGKVIMLRINGIRQDDVQNTTPALSEKTNENSTDFSVIYRCLFPVWLIGCVLFFTYTVISHLIYTSRLRLNSTSKDCKEILKQLGCTRLTVLKSDSVSSPQLTGIIKPTLFIPDTEISDRDLGNILRHECVHCRRFDIAVKWLCVIAKSVHWFNPFVYLLIRKINIECEISCDISASRGLDKAGIESYCETILSLISNKNSTVSPALCMGDTKRNLERRFKAIMEEKNRGKKVAVISAIVAAIIILATLTASAILGSGAKKDDGENKMQENMSLTRKDDSGNLDEAVINASQANLTGGPTVIYKVPKADDEIAVLRAENVNDAENSTVRIHPITGEKADEDIEISHGFDSETHPAVDYKLKEGTVITSPIDGNVKTAKYAPDKGNHIEIEEPDGTTRVIFAHLEKMYVSEGDKVNAGDTVGTVGSTGMSTGPHLHLEYYENGEAVNPVEIFITEENGEILAVHSKPELIID